MRLFKKTAIKSLSLLLSFIKIFSLFTIIPPSAFAAASGSASMQS